MSDSCPTCGGRLEGTGSEGALCLRCAGVRVLEQEVSGGAGLPAGRSPEGRRIGHYELLEELGRGGMGRVFLARQDGLERIVALKVLPDSAAASPEAELRFQREARTVARLRHPHIVAIYDLGRADGCLYFSMEYIPGGDLARRLREQPPGPRAAAALLHPIAEALAYAHREGVLHRDLKPSNILLDGDQPRLADFGLAAELDPGADLTRTAVLLGTPHYLAPEALRDGSRSLSVASDLYAFGVVLFELLTGRTPYIGASPSELLALIAHSDPPAPRLLAPAVPRDLETICLKCLEREPAQRYAGAGALAEDLRRFLAGESILARRPRPWQVAARFARRHRAGVTAGAVVAAILILATAVSTALAVRATRAERRAATAAKASAEMSQFLRNVLEQAAPDQQPDRDLKLRTVLDNAARRINGQFADQPLVEADLRDTLAETYGSLGLFPEAETHLRRALALRQRALPPDDPATIAVMSSLASMLAEQDKFTEAETVDRAAIAAAERTLGPGDQVVLNSMNDLVFVYKGEGRLREAEAVAVQARDRALRALGPDDFQTRAAMNDLASIYFSEERYPESEKLNAAVLAADTRIDGPDSPTTLTSLSNLASVYWAEDKLQESEAVNLRLVDTRRRVLGPVHPDTLRSMHNLATTYFEEGKFAEAERWEKQDFAERRRTLPPDHRDVLSAELALAADELELGRAAEATALGTQALATLRRIAGPSHFMTRNAITVVARIFVRTGRLPEAETLERDSWRECARDLGPTARQTLVAESVLGDVLFREGRPAEAEPLLRHAWTARAASSPGGWQTLAVQSQLGGALAALGRAREAEALELPAYAGLAQQAAAIPGRSRGVVREAGERLIALYTATHRPADADAWRRRLTALAL
ncbi:MAG TPA: tetratricopeptide repeat protein [Opitutaceae bacterium]|jgi:tetratricopeptide (TPR) repeat protein|nr:tetratricopeptide repeat protein [Opitutaceae bacterium]